MVPGPTGPIHAPGWGAQAHLELVARFLPDLEFVLLLKPAGSDLSAGVTWGGPRLHVRRLRTAAP